MECLLAESEPSYADAAARARHPGREHRPDPRALRRAAAGASSSRRSGLTQLGGDRRLQQLAGALAVERAGEPAVGEAVDERRQALGGGARVRRAAPRPRSRAATSATHASVASRDLLAQVGLEDRARLDLAPDGADVSRAASSSSASSVPGRRPARRWPRARWRGRASPARGPCASRSSSRSARRRRPPPPRRPRRAGRARPCARSRRSRRRGSGCGGRAPSGPAHLTVRPILTEFSI